MFVPLSRGFLSENITDFVVQEHTRDKVRRRFTLLVTTRVGGMTGQAAYGSGYRGGPGCCRCPRLIQKGATITVVLIENNKMLNGFGG